MKKKWLRRGLLALAFLATLIVLFYAEEDWRGARELVRIKAELEARGEPMDTRALVPPPIPDEVNVAAAPIFAELYEKDRQHEGETRWAFLREFFAKHGEVSAPRVTALVPPHSVDVVAWQKWLTGREDPPTAASDVLAAMGKYGPILDEVRDAVTRPGVRWPVTSPDNPFMERLPYLQRSLEAARFLNLRASVEIGAGQGEAALRDVSLQFRVGEVLAKGLLVNYLVAASMDSLSFGVLAGGLEKRVWDEAQLRRIAEMTDRQRSLNAFREASRWERLAVMRFHEMSLSDQVRFMRMTAALADEKTPKPSFGDRVCVSLYLLRPRGWAKLDEADAIRAFQDGSIDVIDGESGVVDVPRARDLALRMKRNNASLWRRLTRPYSSLGISPLQSSLVKAAQIQAWLNEARTACALELFRMKNGTLPDTLDALVPDFLLAVPPDPVDGRPLRYRKENQDYLLYSIGWNGTDRGGMVGPHPDQGNWTWASRPALYKFMP